MSPIKLQCQSAVLTAQLSWPGTPKASKNALVGGKIPSQLVNQRQAENIPWRNPKGRLPLLHILKELRFKDFLGMTEFHYKAGLGLEILHHPGSYQIDTSESEQWSPKSASHVSMFCMQISYSNGLFITTYGNKCPNVPLEIHDLKYAFYLDGSGIQVRWFKTRYSSPFVGNHGFCRNIMFEICISVEHHGESTDRNWTTS